MSEAICASLAIVHGLEDALERIARSVQELIPLVRREVAQAAATLQERDSQLCSRIFSLSEEIQSADEDEDTSALQAELESSAYVLAQVRERTRGLDEVRAQMENTARGIECLAVQELFQAMDFLSGVAKDLGAILSAPAASASSPAFSWNSDKMEFRSIESMKPSGVPSVRRVVLESILRELDLGSSAQATASDMERLREAFRKPSPSRAAERVALVLGVDSKQENVVLQHVQEVLDFVPPELSRSLPSLRITFEPMPAGNCGAYLGAGRILLSPQLLADSQKIRETLFHEMMHWAHLEGPASFREIISKHFLERTSTDSVVQLPGFPSGVVGKTDRWLDPYAGRCYADVPEPFGIEVPSCHVEFLAQPPSLMAERWNDPDFRETLLLVLEGWI